MILLAKEIKSSCNVSMRSFRKTRLRIGHSIKANAKAGRKNERRFPKGSTESGTYPVAGNQFRMTANRNAKTIAMIKLGAARKAKVRVVTNLSVIFPAR